MSNIVDRLETLRPFYPSIVAAAIEEIGRLTLALADSQSDYIRRNNDATDRALEVDLLKAEVKALREQDWDALISARLAAQKVAQS